MKNKPARPLGTANPVACVFDDIAGVDVTHFSSDNNKDSSILDSMNQSKQLKNETRKQDSKETMKQESKEKRKKGCNETRIQGKKETAGVCGQTAEYKPVTVAIRTDLHKAVKFYAIDHGMPEYEVINKAIEQYINGKKS